jgi:hypothetical protein
MFAEMPAGTHWVVVSHEGYDDFRQRVTVERGQTTNLDAVLATPSGEVNIMTTPPGIEVAIDGRVYGPSPVRATLAIGEHSFTLNRPGMESYKSSFTVRSGAILTKKVDLSGGSP